MSDEGVFFASQYYPDVSTESNIIDTNDQGETSENKNEYYTGESKSVTANSIQEEFGIISNLTEDNNTINYNKPWRYVIRRRVVNVGDNY